MSLKSKEERFRLLIEREKSLEERVRKNPVLRELLQERGEWQRATESQRKIIEKTIPVQIGSFQTSRGIPLTDHK